MKKMTHLQLKGTELNL